MHTFSLLLTLITLLPTLYACQPAHLSSPAMHTTHQKRQQYNKAQRVPTIRNILRY